jgi:serine phosphatase RsbU (regulator of sigma subunit)
VSPPSVTSTDSFRLRAQRSEQTRIVIFIGVLLTVVLIVGLRRVLHGEVMSDNHVFLPIVTVIGIVLAYEAILLWNVRRAIRESRLLADWRWVISATVEIGAPLALLTILHLSSAQGEVSALSAPGLLVLAIVILLSILRLRPSFTLWTGLIAGAAHAALVIHAIIDLRPSSHLYPVLFTYSALLTLCGVAASQVAREVKRYVREAVDEAAAGEAARQRIQVMERDLSIAREIQRGLIPSTPPALDTFDIAGFNRPADETGGDYYDWQTLPDGRIAVALADVTGHGIGPALVMAVCRAYARASAPLEPQLGPLLNRLNALIHADVGGTRFVTFAIALVDPRHSRFELLSAGHGPILLYRARDQSIERFNGDGFPLGIVPDGEYPHARTLDMASGDVLLMLTDGFFEWQRPGDKEAFGIQRIEELLIRNAGQSADRLLHGIDEAVRQFTAGSAQTDDMTAVAVKRR